MLATLNNGEKIPMIAFGTYKITGEAVDPLLRCALDAGYTSFDTAAFYGNEREIGDVLKSLGKERDGVTVTTKLWNDGHGYDNALRKFEESEKRLGRIDTYLIHWPGKDRYVETWRAFERLYKEGRVRNIGVSNFLRHHLETLLASCEIVPAVDQIECHPLLMDYDTINFCRENGILVEGWRPLLHGRGLLGDERVRKAALKHGKTPAQAVLRFLVQSGVRVLPKSATPCRIIENIRIFDFELDPSDMEFFRSLECGGRTDMHPDEFF